MKCCLHELLLVSKNMDSRNNLFRKASFDFMRTHSHNNFILKYYRGHVLFYSLVSSMLMG